VQLLGAGCRAFPRDVALDVAAAPPGEGGWGSRFQRRRSRRDNQPRRGEGDGEGLAASPGKGRGLRSSGEAQNDNQPRRQVRGGSAEAPGGGEAAGGDGGGAATTGGGEAGKGGEVEEGQWKATMGVRRVGSCCALVTPRRMRARGSGGEGGGEHDRISFGAIELGGGEKIKQNR